MVAHEGGQKNYKKAVCQIWSTSHHPQNDKQRYRKFNAGSEVQVRSAFLRQPQDANYIFRKRSWSTAEVQWQSSSNPVALQLQSSTLLYHAATALLANNLLLGVCI
eukprot:Lankesteria_metandrocarpae@DN10866_c0_g1_i1.p2